MRIHLLPLKYTQKIIVLRLPQSYNKCIKELLSYVSFVTAKISNL